MEHFEVVTPIAAPVGRVFGVSLDVEVHATSMAGASEKAIDGITSGRLKLGDTVTWKATHFGIGWRMTSRISACNPPTYFVDEQVSGPFQHWHHAHHFESDGRGGTLMRDVIDFAAPLGILGTIAEIAVLRRYMLRLIRIRNDHVKAVAQTMERD